QREPTAIPLPPEEQTDKGTHVGRTHLEMVILPRMHMDRKSGAIHQGFQEVGDHREGFFACPALGHRIQYGDLSQPKLVIFVDSASESHIHIFLLSVTSSASKKRCPHTPRA